MHSDAGHVQSVDCLPRQLGVILNPPALVIEWLQSSTGKLYRRRVDFTNLTSSMDAEDVASRVRNANQDLLAADKVSFQQLVSLVDRFRHSLVADETLLPSSPDDRKDEQGGAQGAPGSAAPVLETTLLPSEQSGEGSARTTPSAAVSPRAVLHVSKSSFIRERVGDPLGFYEVEGQKLGQGSFGTVSRARDKSTAKLYAVKTMAKPSEQVVANCRREIEIMKRLDHANVVKLYESFEDHHNIYLIIEFCVGGELIAHIVERGYITEADSARVMQQMLRALHYLHKMRICHRDLKPQNLMLLEKQTLDKATLKLIDFGASCEFQPDRAMCSMVGTPYYIAPEVLAGKYTELCDMWSCGVLLFFLLCGERPFNGRSKEELFENIRQGRYVFKKQYWACVSEDARDLIRSLLNTNLKQRPSAANALNHDWVKNQAPKAENAPLHESLIRNLCNYQAMNDFKKSALHTIAGQIDEHLISDLRAIFERLDVNQDGFVTFDEYKEGLQKAGLTAAAPRLHQLMASADLNHNDVIDYAEFLASALDARRYLQEDVCWSAFKVFDRDGDGRISLAELAAVLHSGGNVEATMGLEATRQVMEQVDINGDGEIDFKEFMAMMRQSAGATPGDSERK